MKFVPIVVVLVLSMALLSMQSPVKTLDNIMVNPVKQASRIRSKRQATSTVTKRGINFVQNVEHSLTQHSETLEQMLESVQKTEDLTKTLIENFANKYLKKPQMHENVEVYHEKTKQSNVTDNIALVPVSKKIPVYEKLLKHKQKIVEVSRDRKNLTLTTD